MVGLEGFDLGLKVIDESPVFLVLGSFKISDYLKQVVISLTQQ